MWLQLCKCIQPSEKFLSVISGSSYYEKLAYVYHHLHVYLNHQKLPILAKINTIELWAFLYFTKHEKGDKRHSFSLKYLLNNLESSSSCFKTFLSNSTLKLSGSLPPAPSNSVTIGLAVALSQVVFCFVWCFYKLKPSSCACLCNSKVRIYICNFSTEGKKLKISLMNHMESHWNKYNTKEDALFFPSLIYIFTIFIMEWI